MLRCALICGRFTLAAGIAVPDFNRMRSSQTPQTEPKLKAWHSQFSTTAACHIQGVVTFNLLMWLSDVAYARNSGKFSLSPEAFVTVLESLEDGCFSEQSLEDGCFSELCVPSSGDLNQAPNDITDRLRAVTSVDVDALGFKLAGDRGPWFAGRTCVQRRVLI